LDALSSLEGLNLSIGYAGVAEMIAIDGSLPMNHPIKQQEKKLKHLKEMKNFKALRKAVLNVVTAEHSRLQDCRRSLGPNVHLQSPSIFSLLSFHVFTNS
jgi:hypothetical protein